ncbi:hypothetical protein OEA41_009602 [Lepraria neglecta]|uniref:DUF7779 domain-containing protein n=1 Tax=Lepraria neglecta TaxID=209136 RepID=A0AAE0DHT5_9LECA|nr:hypothetical protein OEA41_009602 [Lepraria neglecta]
MAVAKVCGLEPHVDAVKRWLSNTSEPWALILDNADDPRLDISPYFPVGNRGIVLITTRNPDCRIYATVGSYELGAMEPDDAVSLILKTTGVRKQLDKSIRESAKPVVATLGYLALAIVQAGAVIRQGRYKMEEYCTIYHQRRHELLSQKAVRDVEDYRYTVYTTWEVSLKMIEEMSSEAGRYAIELLQIFSFLHHDKISEEMFHRAGTSLQSDRHSEWDVSPFRAAVSILLSFSLINLNKDRLISLHPLVHRWTRDRLSPSDEETIWTQTTSTVALSISWTFETGDYRFRKSLVPHVDACLGGRNDGIFHLRDIGEDCQRMASKFALVYSEAGRRQEALQLTEQVVEANKRTLGEEHPDTLGSIHNLAIRYSEAGRRQEALRLTEQVVEANKRTLGEEHPDTLGSIHTLANSYSEAGRRQEALRLTEQVVEANKRTLGEEHPNTFRSIHDLAIGYSKAGRRQEALQLTEQVVEANKRTLGEEHPDTLVSIHNLAIGYSEAGRRQEALRLIEQVVEARKRILGEEHPDTLLSIHTLVALN